MRSYLLAFALLVSCQQTPTSGSTTPVEREPTGTTSNASARPSRPAAPPTPEPTLCPDDMVEVKGDFCTDLEQR